MAQTHDPPSSFVHFIAKRVVAVVVLDVLAFAGVGACATTMSAEEHRKKAAQEQALADAHAARYDEDARAVHLETPLADVSLAPPDYNPTHFENEAANAHAQAARAHLDAADALERSEELACRDIPRPARSACPLFATAAVDDIPRGVRLRFANADAAAEAASLAKCQQAFARTRGFQGLPTCILYARGLSITVRDRNVEIVAADDRDVARVRTNVRAHHAPSSSGSSQN